MTTAGRLTVRHYDFHAQVLAKVERAHDRDRWDVAAFLESGLVRRDRARELFEAIVPELHRYPAIDPAAFRRRVVELLG